MLLLILIIHAALTALVALNCHISICMTIRSLFHSYYSFCTWKCQDVVANVMNSFSRNSASYVKLAY